MKARLVVSAEIHGAVALLDELLAISGTSSVVRSQIVVTSGHDRMLAEVRRGLEEADGVVVTPARWCDLEFRRGRGITLPAPPARRRRRASETARAFRAPHGYRVDELVDIIESVA